MASRRLEVVIAGDAGQAVRALGQTERAVGHFDSTSTRAGSRFSQSWRSGIARVGTAITGLVAGAGLATFFRGAVSEAEQAAQVMRQTNAVIQSTGGVAGITAGHLADLSGRLSNLAAVDDEVIQQGGNLLLTFRNVRAEGGIFDDALASALDMSAALHTELQPNVMAVGRALNDPLAGLSRLTRMGVTFTQQQRDQVAAMVYFGDVAGAQRIILDELAAEFGGAAEANASAGQLMTVAWDNIKETIGTGLLPAFGALATRLNELSLWFQDNPRTATVAILGLAAAFTVLWVAASGPVAWVIAGMVTLGAEWVALYNKAELFRAAVDGVWNAIQAFAAAAMAAIRSIDWQPLLDAGRDLWQQIMLLGESFGGWANVARAAGVVIGAAIIGVIGFLRTTLAVLVPVVSTFIRLGAIGLAGIRAAIGALRTGVAGVSSAVSTAWSWMQKLGAQNLGTILSAARSLASPFISAYNAARSLLSTLQSIANRISSMPSLSVGPLSLGGHARGTESAPPGLAWVGEAGRELVAFGGGERVWPHAQSEAIASRFAQSTRPTAGHLAAVSTGPTVTVNIESLATVNTGAVLSDGDLLTVIDGALRRGHTSGELEALIRRVAS